MFKFIAHRAKNRYKNFYLKNSWHFILEISLLTIIIMLIASLATLYLYRPYSGQLTAEINSEKLELDLNNPPLILNFSVASSSNLSEGAVLKINLKNAGKLAINNIKLNFRSTNKNFILNKIESISESKTSVFKIDRERVYLDALLPEENQEILLKVTFIDKTKLSRVISWQLDEEYLLVDHLMKEIISLPDLILAADLQAEAMIYYHSPQGDQLGSGPLPPIIGLPTNYWVFFEVKSAGDFKNFIFSAELPSGVELTDRRSLLAGDFKYNSSRRQIIWAIPEVIAQNDSYRIGFEINFVPQENQVDQIPPLLTNLKYYAHDVLVNQEKYSEISNLTTNLDFDRLNKGQGQIKQNN